ncbi:protein translocase subunit SecF [Candidatus Peregrinibacteria bacterium]|nr:protein translocase subunit SecF [Candidatus Peregrinibacteria bacterium]
MLRSNTVKIILIIIFALLLGYYDLPTKYQFAETPDSIKNAKVHLGLDLQGGSQLDYKIDLRKVPQKDQKSIVEGVKTVIERRVNGLGVSEPNIYTSQMGDEQHLIVELAGIKDLNEAKKIVGKTIQLEFKEKREKEDPKYKENVQKLAQSILNKILAKKENFSLIAEEEAKLSPDKIKFYENDWAFKNDITEQKIAEAVFKAQPKEIIAKLIEGKEGYDIKDGELVPLEGFFIIRVDDKRNTADFEAKDKTLLANHILISYRNALDAPDTVLRSKEEAQKLAEEISGKLKKGADFAAIVKESSDDPKTNKSDGVILSPIKQGEEGYGEAFNAAALELTHAGEFSEIVETEYGFHIIRADNFSQVKMSQLLFSSAPDPWIETGLNGEHFEHASVTFDQLMNPTVAIQFDDEGAKLFEEITARNVNKPLAIFVGGNLISAPNVNEKISGGKAVITGKFRPEDAQDLARDLNTGAIPAPVILTGQYTIGATLGEEALKTSLKAGVIGLIILALFMIFYYRLPGLVATIALGIYTSILLFMLKSQMPLPFALGIAILIFIAIIYQILRSREGGWEKLITFILACFILFFVTFLLNNAVTLTLAGVAGVILSIGMAVDANILIFERTKEELRTGRPLSSAVDVGFDRAWSSIRDSNFSSLITCGILFYFGTSIIQGFAFNLAAGILISMFTAITITKTLLNAIMHTRLSEKLWIWGLERGVSENKTYNIIGKSRVWFTLSGTLVGISLLALVVFGLKLGIDFNGGTLLDLTFEKQVSSEEIKFELKNIQDDLNKSGPSSKSTSAKGETLESGKKLLELSLSRVVQSGENQFILNMEHIDNATHDKIIENFQKRFGNLTENRFTTIGPVVGETLKRRAVVAVIIAMIMIVLYIAFAFRKVPQKVSPWKFGICAVIALMHDVLIPVGVFAIFRLEVDALFITAILTVLGFSVHDTIVVFDRIRENLKYQQRDESFSHLANKSMTQTMARSINTSLTTLITLMALLLLGSASIFNFILVLVIGIVVGTYSSIFLASPLLVLWQKKEQQM